MDLVDRNCVKAFLNSYVNFYLQEYYPDEKSGSFLVPNFEIAIENFYFYSSFEFHVISLADGFYCEEI